LKKAFSLPISMHSGPGIQFFVIARFELDNNIGKLKSFAKCMSLYSTALSGIEATITWLRTIHADLIPYFMSVPAIELHPSKVLRQIPENC
jgi:hypothetical protein